MPIHWPPDYHPSKCAVHVVKTLEMDVSWEDAWNCLTNATQWPNWYPNSQNVTLLNTNKTSLESGVNFRWRTFGITITCTVESFELFEQIAWSSSSMGMKVYHAWLFEKRGTGCKVTTEETQNGILPRIANTLMPNRMYKFHQIWLEELCSEAKRCRTE